MEVLRLHPFRRPFAGQAVSVVGDALAPVALAFGDVRRLTAP